MRKNTTPDRPKIDYPCVWEYTMIGTHENLMRDAVAGIVTGEDYTLVVSNRSRTGKYCSLRLELTVAGEGERNAIFQALNRHDDVTMVL